MKPRVGDYFDLHRERMPTTRVLVREVLCNGAVISEDITNGERYLVDMEDEVEKIEGNVFSISN